MFNVRDEGEEIKNGINVYPINSNFIGLIVRAGNYSWWSYYSKNKKKFHFCYKNIDKYMIGHV